MGKKTPLFSVHQALGGKIVDFGGWDMPLHYGSQVEEHHRVRQHCGMFDVSHMAVVDINGEGANKFLRYILANDVDRLKTDGKALYSVMLTPNGGVIDDLIVYRMGANSFRLVVNCGTAEKDLAWLQTHSENFEVSVTARPELAIIAVQGPEAIDKVKAVVCDEAVAATSNLKPFDGVNVGRWFIARTGYTGEDGLEIILPADQAEDLWQRLLKVDVSPVGLAARDTLRLEAGMNLYGNEMTESVSPLEANLGWTIAWQPEERNFIGREALAAQKTSGVKYTLAGVVLESKGVLRSHLPIQIEGCAMQGETTSGTFSPTLSHGIGLARIPIGIGGQATVKIRNKWVPVKIVKPCFVRKGQNVIQLNLEK